MDDKGKSIPQRESRALLCGVSRKNEGSDHIQGSILLPVSAQAEVSSVVKRTILLILGRHVY